MTRKILALLVLAACNPPLPVATPEATGNPPPLQTVGVYARVNIDNAMTNLGTTNLKPLFRQLLDNQAISGLALGVHWTDLSPGTGVDNFSSAFLDDAFTVAQAHGKSIKLTLTPGIWLPPWMTDPTNDILTSCDGFFNGDASKMSPTCGTVTFERFAEQFNLPPTPFPVPWNPSYQSHWATVLQNVSGFASSYPGVLAGVDVAGPTGVSPEFILPSSTTAEPTCDPTTCPTGGYTDLQIWGKLMRKTLGLSPPYNDQPFVSAWNSFITVYNTQLSGVTLSLVADTASDLPDFGPPSTTGTVFCSDDTMACESIVGGILLALPPAGKNVFSTEIGGMTASTGLTPLDVDYSLPGIKMLAQQTGVLAGADFDHAITDGTGPGQYFAQMGCLSTNDCPATPEAAIYNVLGAAFYGTPKAAAFSPDPSVPTNQGPLDYIVVDYRDVLYANGNTTWCDRVDIDDDYILVTAQSLLQTAAHDLGVMAGIANPVPLPGAPECQNCVPDCPFGMQCVGGQCQPPCTGTGCGS